MDLLCSFLSCVCYAFVCVCSYVLVVTHREKADLLSFVCGDLYPG